MDDEKSIDTQMPTNGNFDKDENGKDVYVKKYRGTIEYLLYLTASRHDIMFSICIPAHYESAPKESHLKVVRRILRYLHGISKYGLWYFKGSDCNFVDYYDSEFAGCK
ncbi:uncharacterized mitochondrial protein AtMg00810-like [Vicia villosa]|uniref:uncharacterized mitochondrial protein AtMg00810-like n=1 Tax=Vicia villosa TaxID=3911 RepID=UPI00273BEBCF|nr:uncharacterized mitochondrial protein AtMg00810-like [Vicia villosa]